jgi:beta-lactamase class A
MIRVSDNSATNVLIRLVGTDAVNRRLAAYGLEDTLLFRPTFRDGRADVHPELEVEYGLGMSTPRDLARLMEAIAEGRVVHRGACDAMIAILKGQEDRLMIPRSLPFEGEVVVVANKTGWDEEKRPDASGFKGGVRGDAAIVLGPRARYVVAILARRIRDKSPGADNAALVTGAAISRMIYDHFNGEEAPR